MTILESVGEKFGRLKIKNNVERFIDLKLLKNGQIIIFSESSSDLIKYDDRLKQVRRLQGQRKINLSKKKKIRRKKKFQEKFSRKKINVENFTAKKIFLKKLKFFRWLRNHHYFVQS